MVQDLSYLQDLASVPTDEQEQAIRNAVATECIRAIATYLTEVADTMETHGIHNLDVPALRAMAEQFNNRIENDEN